MEKRAILHVDMDAFFAAIEQRDNPELRGKPVIVGAGPHERGVVSTCSYEARTFGVRSAMASREAFTRCPHGIFVTPRMRAYSAVSKEVFSIFNRFTPLVEPVSVDEAFLDVSGVQKLFGSPEEIAEAIRAAIKSELHLTASIGVARNKFLAKLASDEKKPDGLFVVPESAEEIARWLAQKKVGALMGVGPSTAAELAKIGIFRVSDLQAADRKRLSAQMGADLAEHLVALSFGRDSRPLEIDQEEKSISREITFPEDCSDRGVLRQTLLSIADDVGFRLRKSGKFAQTARLKLRWSDFKTITRQCSFGEAAMDDFTLRHTALSLFEKETLIAPVRLIGFGVTGLSPLRDETPDLFAAQDTGHAQREKYERLSRTVDELRKKLGHKAFIDPEQKGNP